MNNYEMVWRSGKDYFSRERDQRTKKVSIRKIDPKWEFFEKDENGKYSYILDTTTKLSKKVFSSQKDEREYRSFMESIDKQIFGGQPPEYNYIRENFYGKDISSKIKIWFLDIEVIEETKYGKFHEIKIRKDGQEEKLPISKFFSYEYSNYEVFDTEKKSWVKFNRSCFFPEKTFPDPKKAEKPVTQIQIYDNHLEKIIILSLDKIVDKERFKDYDNLIFKHFLSEKELFKSFFILLEKLMPTVITAWNGDFFDFPYLTNRAKNLDGVNYRRLSPINKVTEDYNGNYNWEGVYLIDMLQAYKKFTFNPRSSYSLENISSAELGLGDGKVDYGEFNDIIDFYHGDIDKFLLYSIKDVEILRDLEAKLKLIELMNILSHMMGININDAFGTVKPWGQNLTNRGLQTNLVMPYNKKSFLDKSITGGYVREPKKGIHKWLVSIDINSMYPLLGMMAFNMSPETYINEYEMPDDLLALRRKYHTSEDEEIYTNKEVLQEIQGVVNKYDVSFGMNAFFKKEKTGIIPEVVNEIYTTRKATKYKMLLYKALKAKFGEK